jgi:hypothetical protein
MDGKWQVILQTKKRKVTNTRTKETRDATYATILTSDQYQFIVNDYEITTVSNKEIAKGEIEIDGLFYAPSPNAKYCGDNLVSAINIYLKEWHVLSPSKDINSLKEATDYMIEINKMAKELYDLKK